MRIELSYQAILDLVDSLETKYPQLNLMDAPRYEIDYEVRNPNYSPLMVNDVPSLNIHIVVMKNHNELLFNVSGREMGRGLPKTLNFKLTRDKKIIPMNLPNTLHKTSMQDMEEMKMMVNVFARVLLYLKQPKKVVEIAQRPRKVASTNKKKYHRKNDVQYIYDTVYKINKVPKKSDVQDDAKHTKRDTTTDRKYFKDEWTRQGHYRYYRNEDGSIRKRVWIAQTTVHPKGETKDVKSIKVTKVK